MVIVIQNANIKDNINNNDIIYLNKICNLKHIKNDVEVLILNNIIIDNNGIITDYDFFLEEVLITKSIKTIISNFTCHKLEEICQYYKINLIIL